MTFLCRRFYRFDKIFRLFIMIVTIEYFSYDGRLAPRFLKTFQDKLKPNKVPGIGCKRLEPGN